MGPTIDFTPRGIAPLGAAADPTVLEVQTLLKQLGYDPGPLDGIWGTKTKSAVAAVWMAVGRSESPPTEPSAGLLNDLRALVQRQALSTPPPVSLVEATKPPAWKTPLFIGLAAAVGSAALYLLFRESRAAAPVGDVDEGKADASKTEEKPKKARTKKKPSELTVEHDDTPKTLLEKCPRDGVPPLSAFESGTPLETSSAPPTLHADSPAQVE